MTKNTQTDGGTGNHDIDMDTTDTTPLIDARQISRYFGDYCAVESFDLRLRAGAILGLLGPNGAGKSTTLKMLAGYLGVTSGEIYINGWDLRNNPLEARRHMGYLPEHPPVYKDMTVNEYLGYAAGLHGLRGKAASAAVDEARAACQLDSVQHRLIGQLSKGFGQRVGIAQAVLHKPPVIILDEPTVGLDPLQIREIRHLITELGQHSSIILSTHILAEVSAVCDQVCILNQGRMVFSGELAAVDSLEALFFEQIYGHDPAAEQAPDQLDNMAKSSKSNKSTHSVHEYG